jgi:RHS repeat-associated protein
VRLLRADGSEFVASVGEASVPYESPDTVVWRIGGDEWRSWTVGTGAVSMEIVVTDRLRSAPWGELPVARAPDWTRTLYGVESSDERPWARRESLATLRAELFDTIEAGRSGRRIVYDIPDIYLAAAPESKTKLLVGFKAAPFVEPASGLVYLRARLYDPGTGSFLTPDGSGYVDSSNLYAAFAGDPVSNIDPDGNCATCVGATVGFVFGAAWMVGSEINDCFIQDDCRTTGHYLSQWAQFTIAGAEIGASFDAAGVGGGSLSFTLGGAGFGSLGAAASGDWAEFGRSQVIGGVAGLGTWALFKGVGAGVGAIPGAAAFGHRILASEAAAATSSALRGVANRTGLSALAGNMERVAAEQGLRLESRLFASGGRVNPGVGSNRTLDLAGDFYRSARVRATARGASAEVDAAIAAGDRARLEVLGGGRNEVRNLVAGVNVDLTRGNIIDAAVKARLQPAFGFKGMNFTARGVAGPDIWNPATMRAWDTTTPTLRQINRHLNRYVSRPAPGRNRFRALDLVFTR